MYPLGCHRQDPENPNDRDCSQLKLQDCSLSAVCSPRRSARSPGRTCSQNVSAWRRRRSRRGGRRRREESRSRSAPEDHWNSCPWGRWSSGTKQVFIAMYFPNSLFPRLSSAQCLTIVIDAPVECLLISHSQLIKMNCPRTLWCESNMTLLFKRRRKIPVIGLGGSLLYKRPVTAKLLQLVQRMTFLKPPSRPKAADQLKNLLWHMSCKKA